jgi:hypothetical protein
MGKNARIVWLTAIGAVLAGAFVWAGWDLSQKRVQTMIPCPDGPHGKIDLRDFVNQYSRWSITFEGEVQGKGKIVTKLEPQQLQQLSEAVQQADEFRKFVVAGFNACAITRDQYGRLGALFQSLDSLERQIDQLISESGSGANEQRLQQLATEVINISKTLRQ